MNSSFDDSILIIPDENGEFLRKGKNHPDNIKLVELSDGEDIDGLEEIENNNYPKEKPQNQDENQEKWEKVSLTRKTGSIKEWIDYEGLGILLGEDGLVLFHAEQCYNGDVVASSRDLKTHFRPGSLVQYSELTAKNPDYAMLNDNRIISQALTLWTLSSPNRPDLSKMADDDNLMGELKEHRQDLINLVSGNSFTYLSLVRVFGRVEGYVTEKIGVLQIMDRNFDELHKRVLFHEDQCFKFGHKYTRYDGQLREVFPVGLNVTFDAKEIDQVCHNNHGVSFQACSVLGKSKQLQLNAIKPRFTGHFN